MLYSVSKWILMSLHVANQFITKGGSVVRDLLKKHLLKQLKAEQSSVVYPDDLTDDEFMFLLLSSISRNISIIKNLLIGVVAISAVAGFLLVMAMFG